MADNNSKQFAKCSFRSVSSTDLKFVTYRKTHENSLCTKHIFPLSYNASYTIPLITLPCLELITTALCFPFRLFTIHLRATEADLLYFYHKHNINVPSSSCTRLFISPSGTSELDCATTKTDTAESSNSIGRESLHVFFVLGALAFFQVPPLGGSRD